MSVTERARHELHERLVELIGPQRAETLMEYLPPTGWGDVVTKEYLDLRLEAIEHRVLSEVDSRDPVRGRAAGRQGSAGEAAGGADPEGPSGRRQSSPEKRGSEAAGGAGNGFRRSEERAEAGDGLPVTGPRSRRPTSADVAQRETAMRFGS